MARYFIQANRKPLHWGVKKLLSMYGWKALAYSKLLTYKIWFLMYELLRIQTQVTPILIMSKKYQRLGKLFPLIKQLLY